MIYDRSVLKHYKHTMLNQQLELSINYFYHIKKTSNIQKGREKTAMNSAIPMTQFYQLLTYAIFV